MTFKIFHNLRIFLINNTLNKKRYSSYFQLEYLFNNLLLSIFKTLYIFQKYSRSQTSQ